MSAHELLLSETPVKDILSIVYLTGQRLLDNLNVDVCKRTITGTVYLKKTEVCVYIRNVTVSFITGMTMVEGLFNKSDESKHSPTTYVSETSPAVACNGVTGRITEDISSLIKVG